jgi:hypothetical protein
VIVERIMRVPAQDDDATESGIDEVGEGEVDQPVLPSEANERFGAILGERPQAAALATG